jgi:diguanylate cyclase (GGDEF)-like protein
MRTELSPKEIGRLAAILLMASGVLSAAVLPLPQLPGINRGAVLLVAALATLTGGFAYLTPWDRMGKRSTLVMLPLSFVLIGLGNYFGSARSYSYSVYFIVAFVWLGITHPRWTSVWFAPLAAVAYVTPILLKSDETAADASAATLTVPVCILVAEILAWIVGAEKKATTTSQALARSAARLGSQLDEAQLKQSLVEEARAALGCDHAVLFEIDPDTGMMSGVNASGVPEQMLAGLQTAVGQPAVDLPEQLVEGRPLIVEHAGESDRPSDVDMYKRFAVKSYLAIPVIARGSLVGILSCWETSKHRRYGESELSIAAGLAGQAAAALQNARLYEQTLAASRADPLTSLMNRRAFRERLESEVERARRYGRDLSLIVIDVDRFKRINDTFGHQAGDRTLVRIGELLQRNRRMEDGAFRIGGDEFALLLPETGPQGATVLAERLRRRIEHAALGTERDQPLTVSIGVSAFGEHGINVDELFERADVALYDVKAAGGNAIALPATPGTESTNVRLGVDIDAIIEGGSLRPVYQPIFDLRTGTVLGFEAFCRIDPQVGHTPTPTLFRAAAAAGKLEVFDHVCRQIALRGVADGVLSPEVLLFVNMSPAALEKETFDPERIADDVVAAGIDPQRIVIEVTEYERTPRSKPLARNLKRCREAGFMIALDDFGAGGADLDLLAGITFDYVKVDMSFVQGANGVDTRRRVLRGLAVLAVETGAHTIAEGIESVDDLRLVRELGFTAAQGFLLREPAPRPDHSPRPLRLLGSEETVPTA